MIQTEGAALAYELKPNDEYNEIKKREEIARKEQEEARANPVKDLPVYKDMGAVKSASAAVNNNNRKIIYRIVGALIALALIAGIIFGVRYMLSSSGTDISDDLALPESALADKLGIEFKDMNERASYIQQYSGGTVTVRASDDLEVIYIDGKQVGVATDGRKYRFYGVGINDPEGTALEEMTFPKNDSFVMLNDLRGGNSTSYYYCDKPGNRCLVLTVSERSHRIVYMTYYTDLALITKELVLSGE